jgi:DNA-binding transcriptional ArsR family regulator
MTKIISSDAVEVAIKALASNRRLLILDALKDPKANFRPQVDGDLVEDGVCGVLIAEKLGVSQPTVSEHLRILTQAGILKAKRVKQWTFYKRDEAFIRKIKRAIVARI